MGKYLLLEPNGNIQECQIANWNCFLLPHKILQDVGLIDNYYEHGAGDHDYSLMMQRKGYSLYVASNFVGKCDRNSIKGTYSDKTLSKFIRLRKLFSIKGRPIKSSVYFYYKNNSYLGLIYCMYDYAKEISRIILT